MPTKSRIYKRNQGKYTRWITFSAIMFLIGAGMYILSGSLNMYDFTRPPYIRYGVPTVITALAAWFMFWVINRPKTADFLIATEGEMKKVSWSSKKEIIGSTKVVIITAFILAGILFGVDILFRLLFSAILGTGD